MKIISSIKGDRYHVLLTADELANVLGEYGKYQFGNYKIDNIIRDEDDIEISDIYKKHRTIKEYQDSRNIVEARAKLLVLLDALTPIENKMKILANKTKLKVKNE